MCPAELGRSSGHGRVPDVALAVQLARRAKELPSELGDLQAMAKFFSRHMHDGEGGAADAPEDDDGELDLT